MKSPQGPVVFTKYFIKNPVTCWTAPAALWNGMVPGITKYWRIRGMNLDAETPVTIFSEEVWSFTKVAGS